MVVVGRTEVVVVVGLIDVVVVDLVVAGAILEISESPVVLCAYIR